MLEKGFLKNQEAGNLKHQRLASIISQTLLYLGTLVLVSAFAYLFFNMENSGATIGMMLPFLVAGLGLIIVSHLIKRAYTKLRR